MAASIAKLNITLGADASGLGADINKALTSAHRSMLRGGKMIGTALAAGVAAGAATLATAFQQGVKHIDNLSAAASKLGATTGGLAALEHAAKSADASFEGLLGGMEKLQQNLALISAGKGGAAAGALKTLGLDADKLRALAPEDQIKEIAGAYSKLTDQSVKMAVSKGLFGNGGAEMIKILKLGKEGLEEMTRRAKNFGLVISEGQAAAIGKFDDSILVMKEAWKGFGVQLSAQIAPALKDIGDELDKIIEKQGGMETVVKKGVVDPLVEAVAFMADVGTGFQLVIQFGNTFFALIQKIDVELAMMADSLDALIHKAIAGAIRLVAEELKKLDQNFEKLKTDISNGLDVLFTKIVNKAIEAIQKVTPEINKVLAAGGVIESAITKKPATLFKPITAPQKIPFAPPELPAAEGGTVSTALFPAMNKAADAIENARSNFAGVTKTQNFGWWSKATTSGSMQSLESVTENYEKQNDALTTMIEKAGNAGAAVKAFHAEAIADSKKAVEANQNQLQSTADLLGKQEKAAKDSAKKMTDAFEQVHDRNRELVLDMSMAWITGTAKWSDIINQWAQQTIRQFLSVALFGQQVAGGGGLGGIFGALAGGVTKTQNFGWWSKATTAGTGGIWAGIAKGIGSLFGGVRQHGGSVGAGIAYKVGEVGPEMFIPRDAGTIIPNRAMRGGGGMMQPIIVNQQFAPGVQQSHIAVLLDQLRAESKAGVLAAVEEGGTFRRRLRV